NDDDFFVETELFNGNREDALQQRSNKGLLVISGNDDRQNRHSPLQAIPDQGPKSLETIRGSDFLARGARARLILDRHFEHVLAASGKLGDDFSFEIEAIRLQV